MSELERDQRANFRSNDVADMKPCNRNKSPVYKTIWRSEDETLVRKLAKNVVNKKWEIVKICFNAIDEISSVVKEMGVKEKLKEKVAWNVDDEGIMIALVFVNLDQLQQRLLTD